MKKLFYILLLLGSTYVFAQNKGMTYQAVIYAPGGQNVPGVNVANLPLANRAICLQFSLLDATSAVEYQEVVKIKTDEFGMVNITIGSGTQTGGYATSFAAVVWSASAEKSMRVALDATGLCNQYEELSVEKLDAVPFANAAITAGNVSGVVALANGGTGATTAAGARTNLGIGNVDNTSDLNKPMSTATKTYIDGQLTNSTIVDADASTKGKIQLAGDLAGTAAAPTVPGLALKENAANKSTTTTLGTSNVLFPTQNAVKTYVDTAIAGATIVDADASTKGKIQLAGDLAGTAAAPTVPGLALKENAANKSTTTTLGTSNVLFPTQNAVKTYVDTAIAGATIVDADANTKGKIQLAGDLSGTAAAPTVPGLALKLDASLAGVPNGVATLNSAGIIPANQLPPISVASTNVVSSQAQMLALSNATVGSIAVRTDVNKNFILSTAGPSVLANWVELLTPGAPVQSVNGLTGAIQLSKADINLANVDNTSDAAKPVSTATQNALNLKLNTNQVGVANGTASLNALGKIPTDQIPAISFSSVKVLSSQAEMLAQTNALIGSVVIRTDVNKNYVLAQTDPTILANWLELLTPAPPVQSVNGYVGNVSLTKADLGLADVDNTGDINKPVSTPTQNALDLKANLASPTFTGTVGGITKSMVGLANVDNTTDLNKPVSTPTQNALDLKANLASPTFSGTVSGIDKTMVGLGNVDNTTDAAKPVSTATQTALDLKANTVDLTAETTRATAVEATLTTNAATNATAIAAETTRATAAESTLSTNVATNATAIAAEITRATTAEATLTTNVATNATAIAAETTRATAAEALKAPLASPTFTGTVSGIDKTMVGLGNVDNTTDAAKPVSTATQTALDLKANLASPTFTGTVSGIDKTMVGLGNVDNTTDAAKPVSTATQTALDLKENAANKSTATNLGATSPSDDLFPTQKAVKTYVDAQTAAAGVSDGSITSAKILDGTIANIDVSSTAAIAYSKLNLASSIVVGDLANNAVETAKIKDAAVETAKIKDAAVEEAKIKDAAVTYAKIQNVSASNKVLGRVSANAGVVEEIATTGSGDVVRATSPTFVTPELGAATGTSLSVSGQLTSTVAIGTAPLVVTSTTPVANLSIGGNAATVTTNANLTGPITSVGNATTITDAAITNAKLDKANIPLSGFGAATADVALGGKKLTGVGNPTDNQDVATKSYVDGLNAAAGVSDGSITSAKILDGTIANIDVSSTAAIAYSKLNLASSIVVGDLADDAVETSKIKNANVTYAKIQNVATGKVLGRVSANAGVVEEIATTGTGDVVRATSPTLVTPVLGAATATTINKVTITPPTASATLTIADGKTLTTNNSIVLAGTDGKTMTFPTTDATIARTDAAQTFTGVQTFSSDIVVNSVNIGLGNGAVATNTAVGKEAISGTATGAQNSALGYNALKSLTSGNYNTAIGSQASQNLSLGSDNTALGYQALKANMVGSSNTAIGKETLVALSDVMTNSNNTAVGTTSFKNLVTGSNSVALGKDAGSNSSTSAIVTSATNSIFVGADTKPLGATSTNEIVIGNGAVGLGDNSTVVGNATITQAKVFGALDLPNTTGSTSTTTGALKVAGGVGIAGNTFIGGTISIAGGVPAAGKVLTSDANGLGSWTAIPAINLTSGVSGILPVANGGTGSATQNFVDLTTDQTIAGIKALSSDIVVNSVNIGRGKGAVASNTAVGTDAISATATGTDNAALGYNALKVVTSGNRNTAVGSLAATSLTTGDDNTVLGYQALKNNTTGASNVAIGKDALFANSTGYNNVAIGTSSLLGNTTGFSNIAMGLDSALSNTTGNDNLAIGQSALRLNTTGLANTAIGRSALNATTTGNYNSALGWQSLAGNTTGIDNVAVGYNAGRYDASGTTPMTTSSFSVYLGASTKGLNATGSVNETVIGNAAVGLGSNSTVIGNSTTTKAAIYGALDLPNATESSSSITGALKVAGGVGIAKSLTIGSTTASSSTATGALKVAGGAGIAGNTYIGGTISIAGGSPGVGKVLTSDGAGLATWSGIPATDLAAGVTGTLPIANGGTGSATQNFVDLTTAQTVAGAKTFSGNTSVGGTFAATGATSLSSTLAVTGNTTVGGTTTLNGNTSVSGTNTFTVGTGATTIGGTLAVTGATTLNGNTSVSGTNTLTVGTGATALGGTLAVTGATTLNGNTTVSGTNTFTVGTGATALGGTLAATGATTLSSTLAVTGNTTVGGTTTLNGNTSVSGSNTLTVGTGATALGGTLAVTGATTLSSTLDVTGNTVVSGTLKVAGGTPGLGKVLTSDAAGLASWTYGSSDVSKPTATATISISDKYVFYDGAADGTLTLPAATGNAGKEIIIKNRTTKVVTVSRTGTTETIYVDTANSAVTTFTIGSEASNNWVKLVSDGTNWVVFRALF